MYGWVGCVYKEQDRGSRKRCFDLQFNFRGDGMADRALSPALRVYKRSSQNLNSPLRILRLAELLALDFSVQPAASLFLQAGARPRSADDLALRVEDERAQGKRLLLGADHAAGPHGAI